MMFIERLQAACTRQHLGSVLASLPVALMMGAASLLLSACASTGVGSAPAATRYAVDPYWPKPLPDKWLFGAVAGVAVDKHDHIWIIHRPGSFTDDEKAASFNPPRAACCIPAPSVVEFDADGKVLRSWGMAGAGFDFPKREHGIYVDPQDNVWIAGNADQDHQVLKFTADGKFLLQIGKAGQTGGSNDMKLLGKPAHMEVDAAANELYVADGYGNRRVIVFDATTGAYKRHWGAYGSKPDDTKTTYDPAAPPSKQFGSPVHCVRLAKDGMVYVCDRENNRIQVFRKSGEFVREFFLAKDTRLIGSVWDMVLSPDPKQTWMYVADGANNQVHVLSRETGAEVSAFGRNGRMAGQFHWVHNIAIDSKGNIYTAEVDTGKRLQRFTPVP
ncbi:peptidyl-alpha-hydroxyglycine alpha-amidating lyase family protein [Variovorax rhizosphaerae]|uniref:Peptidyl-alpha-hydroxyglycine alpha-amidating lyase family protein n=1 Tax=Variovorax rhizosphaerae TaxID=1836200 RepID=A0ABU8WJD1_9BURK